MIIILNGAPGVGKDTLGKLMAEQANLTIRSFKQPMFDIVEATLGESGFSKFMELYDNRLTKEQGTPLLGGLSPREFMIEISEKWIKPRFGKDYFGCRFVADLPVTGVVATDGGFPDEVRPMLDVTQVVIVRLHRDGYGFAGDSRRFIIAEDFSDLPDWRKPTFLDVELLSGEPQIAVEYIFNKLGIKVNERI